ncbi:adenosylcobinamide-GDP ribazoletransferase [Sporosarcina sp. OR05]|uniref:adenosylcobinamide-GDP ribazoletransferase n=1 Tax=Sporosarcina sp. OR05 TaxID=2969819 RepID=UPI00352A9FCB
MTGFLLALQFFTAIPIRKNLPMEQQDVTRMYSALPLIGALIGLILYGTAILLTEGIGISPLLASFLIVLVGIALTGGLHMDGFADASDAFFSYRDKERRLEIMDDPRIGAFGTMALILLIVGKMALVYELLLRAPHLLAVIIAIPLLSRAGMNVYFTTTRLAKEKGIAHFFKEKLATSTVISTSGSMALLSLIALGIAVQSLIIPVAFAIVLAGTMVIYQHWTSKQFGGVTGDLCGAFIEGTEALLWLVLILCI